MGPSEAQRRTERTLASPWRALLDLPELHVVLFAFLLNFAWEILQSGFYRGISEMPHGDAVHLCTPATFGHVSSPIPPTSSENPARVPGRAGRDGFRPHLTGDGAPASLKLRELWELTGWHAKPPPSVADRWAAAGGHPTVA
jgi:hypothetical protein